MVRGQLPGQRAGRRPKEEERGSMRRRQAGEAREQTLGQQREGVRGSWLRRHPRTGEVPESWPRLRLRKEEAQETTQRRKMGAAQGTIPQPDPPKEAAEVHQQKRPRQTGGVAVMSPPQRTSRGGERAMGLESVSMLSPS